ncbi:MAG TPA: hypothetical protein VKH14_03935 [Candidatus Udaeobacter sp.]|nr:hypothetical protein [Candidatus Udaeobacter sp.]
MIPKTPQHVCAAMAGANFVAMMQILTRDSVPCLLQIAIGIFAVTLPLNLRVYVLDDDFPAYHEQGNKSARVNILFCRFLGLVALNILGFALLFFYLGWLPGILFILTAVGFVFSLFPGAGRGAISRIARRVVLSLFRRVPPVETTSYPDAGLSKHPR